VKLKRSLTGGSPTPTPDAIASTREVRHMIASGRRGCVAKLTPERDPGWQRHRDSGSTVTVVLEADLGPGALL